jgi:hypothetical protein
MTEKSKFAGALGRLNNRTTDGPPAMPMMSASGKRRLPGKRSNPEFSPTTFFVRKDTKRKAARLLEDQDATSDLSDLVEQLLTKWISENSHV